MVTRLAGVLINKTYKNPGEDENTFFSVSFLFHMMQQLSLYKTVAVIVEI